MSLCSNLAIICILRIENSNQHRYWREMVALGRREVHLCRGGSNDGKNMSAVNPLVVRVLYFSLLPPYFIVEQRDTAKSTLSRRRVGDDRSKL